MTQHEFNRAVAEAFKHLEAERERQKNKVWAEAIRAQLVMQHIRIFGWCEKAPDGSHDFWGSNAVEDAAGRRVCKHCREFDRVRG